MCSGDGEAVPITAQVVAATQTLRGAGLGPGNATQWGWPGDHAGGGST